MIPLWTPTNWFSAFMQSWASSFLSAPSPKSASSARAVVASIAAEEESPAPSGTSPAKAARKPPTPWPASPSAQATPRG